MQNEGILKRLMPWTRVPASTPVAARPVVILADNFEEKLEMDEILRAGLLARGIVPARTCVGWDVICRNGNPTDIHDLVRVNAHTATSILVTLTTEDQDTYNLSDGKMHNSSSLKCLMALRHMFYSDQNPSGWDGRRIVVQVQHKANHMDDIFCSPSGLKLVHALDLRDFLNTLMFECAIKPGLSR